MVINNEFVIYVSVMESTDLFSMLRIEIKSPKYIRKISATAFGISDPICTPGDDL